MRQITITPVLNGFIVGVGCQTLVYTDRNKLLGDLASYMQAPDETEKRIIETEGFNKKFLLGRIPQPVNTYNDGPMACGAGQANSIR